MNRIARKKEKTITQRPQDKSHNKGNRADPWCITKAKGYRAEEKKTLGDKEH